MTFDQLSETSQTAIVELFCSGPQMGEAPRCAELIEAKLVAIEQGWYFLTREGVAFCIRAGIAE